MTVRQPIPLPAIAIGLFLSTGLMMPSVASAELSADAQKIVAQVVKENPDVKPVCSSVSKLRAAVTKATTELAEAKSLSGDPHKVGREAGDYLYENCPPPQ